MAINIKPSHKGLLHKNLGVPAGKPIPAGKLEKAEHSSSPAVRKRAVFAENAKHWNHPGKEHYSERRDHSRGEAKHHARQMNDAKHAFDHLK